MLPTEVKIYLKKLREACETIGWGMSIVDIIGDYIKELQQDKEYWRNEYLKLAKAIKESK